MWRGCSGGYFPQVFPQHLVDAKRYKLASLKFCLSICPSIHQIKLENSLVHFSLFFIVRSFLAFVMNLIDICLKFAKNDI